MRFSPQWRSAAVTLVTVLGTSLLAGCSNAEAQDGDTLVVWSMENQSDRVQKTERIIDRFTEQTGIPVKLVAIDENQFSQLVMSSAAAGRLPDVMGAMPLTAIWQMAGNDLLDTGANREIVDALGPPTFSSRTLRLTSDDGRQLAVPSDSWAQLLVYRKDLFAAAGLGTPDTYEKIRQAAQTLNRDGMSGIAVSTSANDTSAGHVLESLALGNGCELVGDDGEVTLNSPQCKDTFRYLGDLVGKYSPPGSQDPDSTRANYFAGKSAMVAWSSYLLDELGGLRNDALPSCPQCKDDPGFLARNSGVVAAIKGPNAEKPAQYGELSSWTVSVGAKRDEAKRFIEYAMSEQAYPEWLGLAPEGKIPARKGTPTDPQRFTRAWEELPAGVDTKRPLREIYPPDTLLGLRESQDRFRRWGFEQRQGVLMGVTIGEMLLPQSVDSMLNGTEPDRAAEEAADEIRAIQTSLR